MTIDEAIEILDAFLRGDEPDDPSKLPASIRLGIEALKRVKSERKGYETYAPDLLPGETEEWERR